MEQTLTHYKVIIWWSEEDGCFLAEMPELPGCIADGKTQEEALEAVRGAEERWFAMAKELNWPIPALGHALATA